MNVWDEQISNLNNLLSTDRMMRTALTTVLAVQKKRIFQEGLDASSNQIGRYSTKPQSVSKKQQAAQTGKTYFKGGYAEYKTIIGKNPGFVILRNTDQMMFDYNIHVLSENQYGLGFSNETNFNKSGWMEDKYKKAIFEESPQDAQVLQNAVSSYLERNL